MLFGASRVPPWLHTTATFLVAFGTTMSAFWILVLNSWMHTPQGFEMRDGVAHATDWFAIVFNPSLPYRLSHMLLASGLTVAFLIAGISAFRWLVGDRSAEVRATFKFGAILAAVLIPVQIFAGDQHGLNTLEYQPAKIAAMEGHWDGQESPVPLILFALPDEEDRENDYEIKVPYVGSLILTHSLDGKIPGLNDFVAADGTVLHPPVAPVFWSFRVMVGTGLLMLLASWSAVAIMARRRAGISALPRPMLYGFVAMAFSGWLATLAGWYTTEIGRQPWLVNGVLSTEAAVADVPAPMVLGTLITYLVVYAALLVAYIGVIFYLARKAAAGTRTDGRRVPLAGEAQVALVTPGE
jgi:cytochrome d ubiquinol oxidase subunit I